MTDQSAQEPTMEEILASIRRIISAATGTAVKPAVRRGMGPEVSTASSRLTISTYFGSDIGKAEANVAITLS